MKSFVQVAVLMVLVLVKNEAFAQICSLFDQTVAGVNLFDYPTFTDTTPIIKTWSTVVNNALRIAYDEVNGGTVAYAWHNKQERIADGFVSTFKFRIPTKVNPGPAGDGFTYFIQNDKIVDLNGGTGDKLGSFGIAKSIAVRVDLCVDRPLTCKIKQVSLSLVNSTFGNILPNLPTLKPVNVSTLLADNTEHTMVVTYEGRLKGSEAKLRVVFDGSTLFQEKIGDLSAPALFNGRFAFFGFTASTSWTETANIDITSWKTDIMPSDSALLGSQVGADLTLTAFDATKPFTFDFGSTVTFKIQVRDSCKTPVTVDNNAVVVSTLFQQPAPGTDPDDFVTLNGNVTNNHDGTYSILYKMPDFFVGKYDLSITMNNVFVEGTPYVGGVETVKPNPGGTGLPVWALVLLLLLILLIILVLSYVVYRLNRYRKKLKDHAEFIEAGKKQAELDKLEHGTSYVANPMVGTIDDLKAQLAKNEEELAALRRRGAQGEDQNYTIEQLQKMRDQLLEEMNRLKREEQEDELKKNKGTTNVVAGTRAKKEFGREQI
jgi:hypothetical protein